MTNIKDGWLDVPYSLSGKKIWIAGALGMVGAALTRRLEGENLLDDRKIDLRDQHATREWVQKNHPDVVIVAAAKVGGIKANSDYPAEFLYDNLMIEANVIHAAHEAGVEKLLFLGSSCIYPRMAAQPIEEDALLSGPLEPTNEAYAVAKIAGLKLCAAYRKQYGCDFISAMPCNLYGPGDKFDAQNSHVIPALIIKAHAAKTSGAKTLEVWGSGKPLREFLYADDLADALVFLLENYSGAMPVNVGSGEEVSIAALAAMVAETVGFKGDLVFDASKPDGTPRKVMDSGRIRGAGWAPSVDLQDGLRRAYEWYLGNHESTRQKLF
ncbi:MAG TPA: GDP-fucose synthetase [Rhodospirillaceae bacterium]|nr:GDP-fucose synthetase [Rhodospirillaceae bacterium]